MNTGTLTSQNPEKKYNRDITSVGWISQRNVQGMFHHTSKRKKWNHCILILWQLNFFSKAITC